MGTITRPSTLAEAIEALLKAGANTKAKDKDGKIAIGTPFIQHSHPSVFPH